MNEREKRKKENERNKDRKTEKERKTEKREKERKKEKLICGVFACKTIFKESTVRTVGGIHQKNCGSDDTKMNS
jgi:hypothetical protein